MDLDEYRERSLSTWNEMAPGWNEERHFLWAATRPVSEWLVEHLDTKPGDTVLELACGTGDTGFLTAEAVGPEGKVVMTDFSAGMIEAAQQEAEDRDIENVEFRRLNAEKMDFDEPIFDGVICRWGYMLMADPGAAFRETHRVLREGGRVTFAAWAEPERNLWASITGKAMVELGYQPPPEPGAPGMFSFADHTRIRDLVTQAGFSEPRIEQVTVPFGWSDVDEHWRTTLQTAGPLVLAYRDADDAERERMRTTITSRVAERLERGDPLDGITNVVVAEKM